MVYSVCAAEVLGEKLLFFMLITSCTYSLNLRRIGFYWLIRSVFGIRKNNQRVLIPTPKVVEFIVLSVNPCSEAIS